MERDRLLLYFGMGVLGVILTYVFLSSWYKPAQDLSPFMISIGSTLLGYYWGSAKAYKPADQENKGNGGTNPPTTPSSGNPPTK